MECLCNDKNYRPSKERELLRSIAHHRGIRENWPIVSVKVLTLQYHKRFYLRSGLYHHSIVSHYVLYSYVCRDDVGKMANHAVSETVP